MNPYEISKLKIEYIVEQLNNIAPKRFSSIIVNQIGYLPYQGMNEPYQFILPEIEAVEKNAGSSQTKEPEQFKRPDMVGLWKKHFYLPQFLPQNIQNYWQLNKQKSNKLRQHILPKYKIYEKDPTNENAMRFSSKVAQDLVNIPNNEWRTGKRKKTGEYIIFKKYKNKNYYLCLGAHNSDEEILQYVTEAYKDFPFLED